MAWQKPTNNWKCKFCGENFKTQQLMAAHDKICSKRDYPVPNQKYIIDENGKRHLLPGCSAWNKGLTKETNKILEKASQTFSQHIKDGTYKPIGHPHTEEQKRKIGMFGGYRKGSGRGKKGWYKGYFCDSSWELAFVIYNIEHNIKFERNKKTFKYTFNGKEYHYLPDFIINDQYIEIKGYWSKQWQAKLDQFPKEEKLEVISENEIKPYLEYVENKYGKDFIKLYENKCLLL